MDLVREEVRGKVSPACAGMVPRLGALCAGAGRLPRVRGDGPQRLYPKTDISGGSAGTSPYHSGKPPTPEYHALMTAIKGTEAYRAIAVAIVESDHPTTKKYYRYLKTDHELFARAYAQYVQTKHAKKDPGHRNYLIKEASAYRQWHPDHFNPIERAFDKLFKAQGLHR